jgi:hypothetical protein
MKQLLILMSLVLSPLASAESKLSAACEAYLIYQMPQHQIAGYDLEFMVEEVREDFFSTIVIINGYFADEGEDYFYRETHQVLLKKGTCEIQRVDFLEDESK